MSDKIIKYAMFTSAQLANLSSITSGLMDVRSAKAVLSMRIKATSATAQGAVDFKIDMATSDYPNDTSLFKTGPFPDLDNYNTNVLATWAGTPNPADWQVIGMPSPLAPFVAFKFTGLGANPADTIITAKYIVQESC